MMWLLIVVAVAAILVFLADRRQKRHGGEARWQARGPDQHGPPGRGGGIP